MAGGDRLDAGDLIARLLRAAGPVRGVAHPRDDVVDRQRRRDLGARQQAREVAGDEGDFGVRLGARLVFQRHAVGAGGREQLLRVERRNAGGEFGGRHRQVGGDAHERAHPHHLAVADAVHGGDADDLAGAVGFAGGRQPVALARAGELVAAADRAAHDVFDAVGQRGEIGFAVERRENGAAHQSSAAQAGENRAGKPLRRDAAAIDRIAGAAVHRKRRLVAEIDRLVIQPRPVVGAPPSVIQSPSPALAVARRAVASSAQRVSNSSSGTMPWRRFPVNDGEGRRLGPWRRLTELPCASQDLKERPRNVAQVRRGGGRAKV